MSIFCLRIHLGLHLTDGLEGRRGSPKVLQQASGKARAEPKLPLPAPWATALLTLLLCKGTAPIARWRPLQLTTPLPHPVCPFPALFPRLPTRPSCACAHTRVRPRARKWLPPGLFLWALGVLYKAIYQSGSSCPSCHASNPLPPTKPVLHPLWEGRMQSELSRRTFFVSGSGGFSVSPFPPSASPMGLRTSAASVWCVLSSNQRLEKVYFVLFPSALPEVLGT